MFAFSPELPQGFARLLGPTGGYLMAYPIAAFVTGLLAERGLDRRYFTSILAMSVGLSVIFAGGVLWIARFAGIETALATGLYPFIIVDVIKVVAAGLVLPTRMEVPSTLTGKRPSTCRQCRSTDTAGKRLAGESAGARRSRRVSHHLTRRRSNRAAVTRPPVSSLRSRPARRARSRLWQRPDQIMDAMGVADGSVVADIGAGSGWFTIRLARRVGPQGLVYAEDVQKEMINAISRRVSREGPRQRARRAGTEERSAPAGATSLDAVLMVDAYHEIENRVAVLTNLARALKPQGRIGVVDFRLDGTGPGPSIEERVSPDVVVKDATEAGLRLIRQEPFLPYQYFLIFGK